MKQQQDITRAGMLLALFSFVCITIATAREAPVKVYILAGQSNMVGIGSVYLIGRAMGEGMIELKK